MSLRRLLAWKRLMVRRWAWVVLSPGKAYRAPRPGERDKRQKRLPVLAFPLAEAVRCVSCDFVSNSRNDHCAICGAPGMALQNLERVLTREPLGQRLFSGRITTEPL